MYSCSFSLRCIEAVRGAVDSGSMRRELDSRVSVRGHVAEQWHDVGGGVDGQGLFQAEQLLCARLSQIEKTVG